MRIAIHSIFSFSYHKDDVFHGIEYNGYELVYFMNGRGTIIENNKTYSYQANDVHFCRPHFRRDLICKEATPYICIRFDVIGTINDLSDGIYHCPTDEIYKLFKNIMNQYKDKEYKYYDYSTLMVQQILIQLARLLSSNTSSNQNINNLIKEIDSTLRFDKSVQEMSDSVGYNYDYFRQKFKSITGQSVSNYIANKRIENACKLLKENNYTCTEISNLCGFSSPSQFSKLFKRTLGISPLSYQKHLEDSEDT